eukprot:ANDGO_01997.mRNA.1 Uncharacterized protein MJ1055
METLNGLFLPIDQWISLLLNDDQSQTLLSWSYGSGVSKQVLMQRRSLLVRAILGFLASFQKSEHCDAGRMMMIDPSTPVAVVRCPGRVNLRGMHIDSHGGACNAIATDRETVLVFTVASSAKLDAVHVPAALRPTTTVILSNGRDADVSWFHWLSALGSSLSADLVKQVVQSPSHSVPPHHVLCVDKQASGSGLPDQASTFPAWCKYVFASIKVLEDAGFLFPACADQHSPMLVGHLESDLPSGCGISSSHALLMVLLQSLVVTCRCAFANSDTTLFENTRNRQGLDRIEILELARAAEFKAGKVTGLGDQGAMEFSKASQVVHANFYQDDLVSIDPRHVPLPTDEVSIVVVNSLTERDLSGDAKVRYAIPRFAYSIGLALVKQTARRMWGAAELDGETSGHGGHKEQKDDWAWLDRLSRISSADGRMARYGGWTGVYQLLRALPARTTVDELQSLHPELHADISRAASSYLNNIGSNMLDEVGGIDVRGPLLYGVSECARSERFFELLHRHAEASASASSDHSSHVTNYLLDACRLMSIGHLGDSIKSPAVNDEMLEGLIQRTLLMEKSDRSCALELQPGSFGASTTALDAIQELLISKGALGASLTGAGLGGVVVALVPNDQAERVVEDSASFVLRCFGACHPEANSDDRHVVAFRVFPVNGAGFVHPHMASLAIGAEAALRASSLRLLPARQSLYPLRYSTTEALEAIRASLQTSPFPSALFSADHKRFHVVVTGGAGFIGAHVSLSFAAAGHDVTVLDDCNDYYDPLLKFANLWMLTRHPSVRFRWCDIRSVASLESALASIRSNLQNVDLVVHLAARAGVRPSVQFPELYKSTNVTGTQNVFDACVARGCRAFVYASSSSVYGAKQAGPFREDMTLSTPESPYAATKAECEVISNARAYECEQGAFIGLRFFTVDGPMLCGVPGRPDMAIASFIRSFETGGREAVTMYGDGEYQRDFSFVQDIVQGILRSADRAYVNRDRNFHEVFNLGEQDTTTVKAVILMIAQEMGLLSSCNVGALKDLPISVQNELLADLIQRGLVKRVPPPAGDVPLTHACINKAKTVLGYAPAVKIQENVQRTVMSRQNGVWFSVETRKSLEAVFDKMHGKPLDADRALLAKSCLRRMCVLEPEVGLWQAAVSLLSQ